METISFTKLTLHSFIHSQQFAALNKIPISKHRAVSQINNPRTSEDDIILVAQFDENILVGYLGILPDYIYHNEEFQKIGWLSCFWIDEHYKSKNVAANLFLRVIRAWQNKIFITNFVPWLEPVYQKIGIFEPVRHKSGLRCYLRFNLAEILPPKKPFYQHISFLLKAIDFAFNTAGDVRLKFIRPDTSDQAKPEYLSYIDEDSEKFIVCHTRSNLNRRSKPELEWILNNPWIHEGVKNDVNGSRYYFTSFSKRFFYQLIRIRDHRNKICAIVMICVRNNQLTVPYLFSDSVYYGLIGRILLDTMLNLKLNMVTTFNDQLATALKKIKCSFIFSKKLIRPYFISKVCGFATLLDFQDGDGDCVFY